MKKILLFFIHGLGVTVVEYALNERRWGRYVFNELRVGVTLKTSY